MAREIPFPDKPFHIVSKVGRGSWVLTRGEGDRLAMRPWIDALDETWEANAQPGGGATLRHLRSGLVMTYETRRYSRPQGGSYETPEGPVWLAPQKGPNATDQAWRAETVGDSIGLNTRLDWEFKLNLYRSDPRGEIGVYHWDRGADNESWALPTHLGLGEVRDIHFDLLHAVSDDRLPSMPGPAVVIDNRAGRTTLVGRRELMREAAIGQAIGLDSRLLRFAQPVVVGRAVHVNAENDFSVVDVDPAPLIHEWRLQPIEDMVEAEIEVPAGRARAYWVEVREAEVQAGFSTQLEVRPPLPWGGAMQISTQGSFVGRNPIETKIMFRDVTDEVSAGDAPPTGSAAAA